MEWERFSTDELEQRLHQSRVIQAQLAAGDLEVLEELDRRQVATGDGARSLSEWVAARVDVAPATAKRLVRTMRRTVDQPELREALAEGVSFDRVEALSRIAENVGLMEWADVNRIHHEATKRTRIKPDNEQRSFEDRFLVLQPNLDKTWWRTWGGFDGYTGELIDKTLTEAADHLPAETNHMPQAWKRATALVQTLMADEPPPTQITVFVEAKTAVPTNGEAGVVLESGTRVGPQALQAVLCDSIVEVTARAEDGQPMAYGRKHRTAPPAMKRALLAETGHTCAVDGCTSRHRLQAHHINHWHPDGTTDPDNLVILCWYHHHVVVHEQGFQIQYHPDRRRIRLTKPKRGPP